MRLLKAIVDYWDTTEETLVMFVEEALTDSSYPYCVVTETDTEPEAVTNSYRIDRVTVRFTIFANSRTELEELIESVQETFTVVSFSIPDRQLIGTVMGDRSARREDDCQSGYIEIVFLVLKE